MPRALGAIYRMGEAACHLMVAWRQLHRRDAGQRTRALGRAAPVVSPAASPAPSPDGARVAVTAPTWHAAVAVRCAIRRVHRLSGHRCGCLVQAMAGARMLQRRGIASTIVLGVAWERTPAGTPPHRDHTAPDAMPPARSLAAHAWLRLGPHTLLGGEAGARFTPVAQYEAEGMARR